MSRLRRLLPHLAAAFVFLALSAVWTWPLVPRLSTDIPGWPGDNLAFLWNDWWMRHTLAADGDFFRCDRLFAPFGLDLTLHTHTAFSSWLSATALGSLPLVVAHNVLILLVMASNGFAAYLLAWRRVGDRSAALMAGLVFGGSPYLSAHLLGHVNLLTAWGLPLFAWCLLDVLETGSLRAAVGAAVAVVVTGFNDYYYVIYCGALTVALYGWMTLRVEWVRRPMRRAVVYVLALLLAIDMALAIAVIAVGGFSTSAFGVQVTANRPTNLLAFAWMFAVLLLLERWRPHVTRHGAVARRGHVALAVMAVIVIAGLSPLWLRGIVLAGAGEYVAPSPSWRSGPSGVDLLTLVLGNPWHGLAGAPVRALYERLDLNVVEGVGWLGAAPACLSIWAVVRWRGDREVRLWRWVAAAFFVWSFGPWLRVAGVDTGLLLPQNVLAQLPIASNARMPGRAMVVVFMAVAMLTAIAFVKLKEAGRGRWRAAAALIVVADFWPAPFLMTRVETPPMYATLRELPPGIVCELPVGARDGLRSIGAFDDHVLAYQMTHGHPLVGGFAARVPHRVHAAYLEMPVLRSLWLLSDGRPAHDADVALAPPDAGAALGRQGIRYLVLNRALAPSALAAFVEQRLPLRLVERDGVRELYELAVPASIAAAPR